MHSNVDAGRRTVKVSAVTGTVFRHGYLRGFMRGPYEYMIAQVEDEFVFPEIRGRVVGEGEPSGWPMEGVLIQMMGPDKSEEIRSAISDEKGFFHLPGVPPGRYRWKAIAFGFQSVIGTLRVCPGAEVVKTWEIVLCGRVGPHGRPWFERRPKPGVLFYFEAVSDRISQGWLGSAAGR